MLLVLDLLLVMASTMKGAAHILEARIARPYA